VAHCRRWLPLAVAALATALLAGGFGLAANQLAAPRSQPAPHLKTVSTAALTRLGLSLSAPSLPPYCRVTEAAAGQGWLRAGSAGCAISRDAAESAARRGGSPRVVESVLASVTSTRTATIGHHHLAWLVVVQQSLGACQQNGGWSICVGGARGFGWNQLALVDAHDGGLFSTLRLSPMGGRPQTVPAGGLLGG
jgi:hypothetical protein